MLVFLVPLQSPAVSRDWGEVSRLAERTLRSICRQTSDTFRAILICNERPQMEFTHPALTIIEDDFAIPGPTTSERMADKSRKLHRGLVQVRGWAPFHLACVDADDCVSNRLAAFTQTSPRNRGWYFRTGYMHDAGSRLVFRRAGDFHLVCGTSHIVRCEDKDLPSSPTEPEDDFWVLKYGHTTLEKHMRDAGTPLHPLPFIGAIYNTATGENDSRVSLKNWRSKKVLVKKMLNYRWLSKATREEFGLYELPR